MTKHKIYVASSWRNTYFPEVVTLTSPPRRAKKGEKIMQVATPRRASAKMSFYRLQSQ